MKVHLFWGVALLAPALLSTTACATNQYMDISLQDAAPGDLQQLARNAKAGDKHAQLELGIAFEEGRGVARDLGKARVLYQLAATDSGGPLWVYSPPVAEGQRGRVEQVGETPRQRGLNEARARLKALDD